MREPQAPPDHAVRDRFNVALESLVEQVKADRSVLAAILCGSLSHDAVWAKSDIDLVLVTIDDRKVESSHVALYADGANVHTMLMPRAEFRATVEGALRNSFVHSFLTKGRLLYSHDESITALCAGLAAIGERDTQVQLLRAATFAMLPIYKAHKFLLTRGDLEYTALWILYAATPLAQIEVLSRRLLVDREVIPQAMQLNPAFFGTVYTDLLNSPKSREGVERALDAVDRYLAERAPELFAPVLEHLREAGEARSSTEIEDWFRRNMGVEGVTTACEYLADEGLIGKASVSVQLTRRSNIQVQELAFYHLSSPHAD
jgi:hypothetical protein